MPTSLKKALFDDLLPFKSIKHTIHGIIDTPEYQLNTELTVLNIKLIDQKNNNSPKLSLLTALSLQPEVTILLGMKGLFDNPNISFKKIGNQILLNFVNI